MVSFTAPFGCSWRMLWTRDTAHDHGLSSCTVVAQECRQPHHFHAHSVLALQDLAEKIEQLNAAIDEVSSKIGQDSGVEDNATVAA